MKFHHPIIFLLISLFFNETSGVFKITSAKCDVIDREFGSIETCRVKAISRNRTAVTVTFKLNQIVLREFTMRAALFKRANGWRPFLYSVEIDVCQFLLNPKKEVILNIFYELIKKNFNATHTCPYKAGESITLDSYEMDGISFVKRFPIDVGEYAAFSKWYFRNKLVISMDIFVSYTDYTLKN